jgi:AcrR family transcriptional regulator
LTTLSIVNAAVAEASETPTRGHKKKARTRLQLLDAALAVLADRGEAFSVSDVVTRAGVSQGTFYNYFVDRDALLDELVAHTVEVFATSAARTVDEVDPAVRFARISARALRLAAESPDMVRFALRLEAAQRALLVAGPLAHLRQDLLDGHRLGRYPEPPDDAALDVIFGSLLLAARRVLEQQEGAEFRSAVIWRLLMSLGLERAEARRIADEAVAVAVRA